MGAASVVGVDLGGSKLLAGAFDEGLELGPVTRRSVVGIDQATLLDTLVDAVLEVAAQASAQLAAVGFGIPCLIDERRGMALLAVHLPIADLAFRAVMAERLGVPAVVDNDGNAAALAEHRLGAARGCEHAIVLTVGTGVGGGLIVDGRLVRGAIGAAGEPGHVVVQADGPRCHGACPNRGCLEALASGSALARAARRLAVQRADEALARALAGRADEAVGPLVTAFAQAGNATARAALEEIGTWLGVGLAGLVNLLNPERVVIGGGVAEAGELLLAPARAELGRRALGPALACVEVVPAHFGARAGMVGAALAARDALAHDGGAEQGGDRALSPGSRPAARPAGGRRSTGRR